MPKSYSVLVIGIQTSIKFQLIMHTKPLLMRSLRDVIYYFGAHSH